MSKNLVYRWLIGVFLTLFIGLQSYSIAHASEHGDEPHEHDGIACIVTVLVEAEVAILPAPPVFGTVETKLSETVFPGFKSALYLAPQNRAPPPRGPPATHQ